MAELILSLVIDKLTLDLLAQESDRSTGVDEQLIELISDLDLLRSLLKDAYAKKHESELVRNCLEEIKEIIFDLEDAIETFRLKEELRKRNGIKMRRFSCITVDLRKIASEMRGISKFLSNMISHMQEFGVQQMIVDGSGYSESERLKEMQRTFSYDNESNLVGLEENIKKLVGYLVEEESIQVVSICGMGGIGKTTLARQVCNHEVVKNHFDGVAWVCVSLQFSRKYVWGTILQRLSSEYDEHSVSNMTEDELQDKLFRLLETSKALIVLDDIWKEEDWDSIKPMFPRTKGWKILLTSRNEGIALREDPTRFAFQLGSLTLEESWTLFGKIAFPTENNSECKVDEGMVEVGKEMIKHCGGLPLAVKLLGRLLATKFTLGEWKSVYENIGDSDIGTINHVVYLSYEELPIYLKQCSLYLAHLPENFSIDVDDLSYYWAAEGISRPRYDDGASIREVTDGYIEDLVKRNMVIPERDDKTSRLERCRLHDIMRKVCLLKVKEENFVQIVDARTGSSTENSQSYCKSRRLVIQSSDHPFQVERYIQNPRLRSLLFIKHYWGTYWKVPDLFFTRLKLVRLLDLSRSEFKGENLPSNIGKLIHLRYLSLYMAKVSRLPYSMRNLKELLYLNLCVGSLSPTYMRNFLEEMLSLIYLFLPDDMQDKVKLELGNLINLETLENFSTKHSNVTDLQHMTRLRTLSIIFNGEGCTMETLSSILGELRHLEKLTIGDKRVVGVRVMGKVLPVNKVGLGQKSLLGSRMVCSRGGFPKLKRLYLNGLSQWDEWIVEEGSMSLLQTLSISWCQKLKALPDGLRFITSLEELTIITSERKFKEKLSSWGEDYYKVQHIPHMTISYEECHNTNVRVYDL